MKNIALAICLLIANLSFAQSREAGTTQDTGFVRILANGKTVALSATQLSALVGGGGGGLVDADYGDVTVSGGGISFNNLTVREASIVGTSISGGGTLNFSVRDGGSPANVMELVTTNSSTQGMTSHLGLIEDVNLQTGTTYTFISADRNVVAGGSASQTYTLQVIGSGAGQTASGRVIYIYNDTSFTLTINAGAGNTINGVASLIVPFNTGVTVKALTSSKWGSF